MADKQQGILDVSEEGQPGGNAEPDTSENVRETGSRFGNIIPDGVHFLHDHKGPLKQPTLVTASRKIPAPFCGYNDRSMGGRSAPPSTADRRARVCSIGCLLCFPPKKKRYLTQIGVRRQFTLNHTFLRCVLSISDSMRWTPAMQYELYPQRLFRR